MSGRVTKEHAVYVAENFEYEEIQVDGPDEDALLDFDRDGRLVAVTIEHASKRTELQHLKQQPQFEIVYNGVRSED